MCSFFFFTTTEINFEQSFKIPTQVIPCRCFKMPAELRNLAQHTKMQTFASAQLTQLHLFCHEERDKLKSGPAT